MTILKTADEWGEPMPVLDARYYKTVLICAHKSMGGEVTPLIASTLPLAPVQNLNTYPTRKQLVDLQKSFEPKLFFLDCTSDSERAFTTLAEIASVSPNVPVVSLLANNSPELILRCMRQGATEFLIRPFTADQFASAFEKVLRLYPAPQSKRLAGSKAIAVIPVKGACGATTIACNLAHHARKVSTGKTLLADLDPVTGTVSFLFKLKTNFSFLDVLSRGTDSVDPELWKQLVVPNQGIDILLPPENMVEGMEELPEATPIIEAASQNYDTVVLDCGSPFGRWNMSVAMNCDEFLLVTTNELASLHATQRLLNFYHQAGVDFSKLKLVINRYNREVGIVSENISKVLGNEVAAVIPSDYEALQKATMEGKPVASGSPFSKAMTQLAEKLISSDRGSDEGKPQNKKRFGLF